jgi:hypothetical protein
LGEGGGKREEKGTERKRKGKERKERKGRERVKKRVEYNSHISTQFFIVSTYRSAAVARVKPLSPPPPLPPPPPFTPCKPFLPMLSLIAPRIVAMVLESTPSARERPNSRVLPCGVWMVREGREEVREGRRRRVRRRKKKVRK